VFITQHKFYLQRVGDQPRTQLKGWRGRIGVIYPSDGWLDDEFSLFVPRGVSAHVTRTGANESELRAIGYAEDGQLELIEAAARELACVWKPNCIAFACTSGSFSKGKGYDREIARKITNAAGTSATTAANASVEALKRLQVKKVAVGAPYEDELCTRLRRFLQDYRFSVVNLMGLGLTGSEICEQPPSVAYDLARKVDRPEADGVFISCTGFRTAEVLQALEDDLGKPVVSANQALMWRSTRLSGVKSPVVGYGRLLGL